jgi:hypothetical protein
MAMMITRMMMNTTHDDDDYDSLFPCPLQAALQKMLMIERTHSYDVSSADYNAVMIMMTMMMMTMTTTHSSPFSYRLHCSDMMMMMMNATHSCPSSYRLHYIEILMKSDEGEDDDDGRDSLLPFFYRLQYSDIRKMMMNTTYSPLSLADCTAVRSG